jgi:hypothetical protein
MKKETAILLGVVAVLGGALCLVTGALVFVLFRRPWPVPSPRSGPPTPSIPVTLDPAAGAWAKDEDPMGFSVELPRGWTAEPDHATGRVRLAGPDGEIDAWPVFVPGRLDATSAPPVLARLAAKVAPTVAWGAGDSPQEGVARLRGRTARGSFAVALLTWVMGPDGAAAHVYVVLPGSTSEETVARIVGSFKATGSSAAGSAAAGQLEFVKYTDPYESSFTVEVPRGWKTEGGLKRFAPTEVRAQIVTTSPEGDVMVSSGDFEIPTFCEPTQLGMSLGFTEGKWYAPGGTVKMMIRRYVPGLAMAKEYVGTKVRGLTSLELVSERERPDLVQVLNRQYQATAVPGSTIFATAGEVAFKGKADDTVCVGSYFLGTTRTVYQAPGIEAIRMWNVTLLNGYVATEKKAGLARQVLDRLVRSPETNPEWARMQQGITAESVRIQHDAQEDISRTITDSYWKRSASDTELSRRRSNATLGVEDVVDQASGRQWKVESGSNYYWLDPQGTIVGTNTYGAPTTDFRELVRRP